jgi:hypothetical protein
MFQGGADISIPSWTACEVSADIGSSTTNWYVDNSGDNKTSPSVCAENGYGSLSWKSYAAGSSSPSGSGPVWNPTNIITGGTMRNLVWITDRIHTDIVPDGKVAWPTFYAFVHNLGWNVDISSAAPGASIEMEAEVVGGP